nr:ribonuclease H-like domain-containing protein [Tanacetum cinerariifolium]
MIKVFSPKTAEEVMAREKDRKARTTLLMALPKDHLAKVHKMANAKEMWEAIKSIFGGNDESKKMHKYFLKQQFEGFSVSTSEGLHKGYDRFQTLLSQLEIHGASVSPEDANQKFLRSLDMCLITYYFSVQINPIIGKYVYECTILYVFCSIYHAGQLPYTPPAPNVSYTFSPTPHVPLPQIPPGKSLQSYWSSTNSHGSPSSTLKGEI